MPTLIRHRCTYCGKVITGACDCRRNETDNRRGSSAERGYGGRWQTFRAWFLLHHPICNDCGVAPASDVHHVQPLRETPELQYDESNCRALCHSCHAIRTARGE